VPLEETNIVLVDETLLAEAEGWIESCEQCSESSESAEYSFDQILDSVTGCDPAQTDYLMYRVARCPRCYSDITEKTLVRPV
jgi:hypothetical protein